MKEDLFWDVELLRELAKYGWELNEMREPGSAAAFYIQKDWGIRLWAPPRPHRGEWTRDLQLLLEEEKRKGPPNNIWRVR